MNDTLTRFDQMAAPFTAVVASLPDPAWDQPSPCEGWSARDVLDHVISTEREFFAGHDLDLGAAPDVAGSPVEAWQTHLEAVRSLLGADAVAERAYDGYFGPTTIGATVLDFYGWDLLPHRWDIARAAGRHEPFSDEELNTLEGSIAEMGDQLYAEGICKPPVPVAEGADRQTQVLARLGRSA